MHGQLSTKFVSVEFDNSAEVTDFYFESTIYPYWTVWAKSELFFWHNSDLSIITVTSPV